MKNKSFDCVEMKHNAAAQIGSRLSACSIQEQLAYWNQKSAELMERLPIVAEKKDFRKEREKLFKGMSVDDLYNQAVATCAEASDDYRGKR